MIITHVCEQMCNTCIFRPGNLMHLNKGTVERMVKETDRKDDNVICHKSKGLMDELPVKAWCRGSVDRRPGQAVRIMQRLDMLQPIEVTSV